MKKWIFGMLLSTMLACDSEVAVNESAKTITYEVITSSGQWFGEYITEMGQKECFCAPPLPASGWQYTFRVPTTPFELHIDATSEYFSDTSEAPAITTNIYVNGELVATNTSNWAPGVASADYTVR